MTCIINTKLGESKGQSRIWLEGVRLERGGFSPSTKYELVISERKVILKVAAEGAYTVSKRKRNGKLSPIIDLSNQKLTQAFEGVEMLRVLIRDGSIIVSAHFQQGKVERREERHSRECHSRTIGHSGTPNTWPVCYLSAICGFGDSNREFVEWFR